MIYGECFTNLDDYRRERWPEVFAAVPRVGEVVQAQSGKILKVVRVTHTMILGEGDAFGPESKRPRIRVELNQLV